MEVFISNIGFSVSQHRLMTEIAQIVHSSEYSRFSPLPLNFHIHLFRDKRGRRSHSGNGALTLPKEEVGLKFLNEYGEAGGQKALFIGNRRVKFSKSKNKPRPEIVETIVRLPYQDPKAAEEKEKEISELQSGAVQIKTIQFGWECRDSVLSVEWEEECESCFLLFVPDRREIRVKIHKPEGTFVIAIRFSQVDWILTNNYLSREHIIFFCLLSPPAFEIDATPTSLRKRLVALPFSNHARVVPYLSLALRLVCRSQEDLMEFRRLSRVAHLQDIYNDHYPVERRNIFSSSALGQLQEWLESLKWCVAFQVQSLVSSLAVDVQEMLSLQIIIEMIILKKGAEYAASLLRNFGSHAKMLYWSSDQSANAQESMRECFDRSRREYDIQSRAPSLNPTDTSLFDCHHVIISPSSMFLEGPYPDRSNRVIRSYGKENHSSFLRVSFVDDDRLQFRFDREVDGPEFIRMRVGGFLLNGLNIAGRSFKFLAYSQSALKEHAVWFVKPFYHEPYGEVDAPAIIKSLGEFSGLSFDPKLIYCPARYAARLSQAFTATDASVSVQAEEIIYLDDIESGKWCHTDGVGTMSGELAQDISKALRAARRKGRQTKTHPRAFQIRFMGSKGMLSVDYKLDGHTVCLRPSMIKFQAPESRDIEIARAFDRPGGYFLNRPLIMLLEGLGVPYETFEEYQDMAVSQARQSTESLERAARFLELHGLGTSFRLSSIMLNLDKLGIDPPDDESYQKMMEFGINHVLRELKHHARIPIPGAWTLVGVADVHRFLKPNEIFACVKPLNSSKTIYLEGPVLISRSPTIHPGDVQIVNAIGSPPANSCFAKEPLPNTVVFSVQDERPLASCLGGGDLDGDVYNLIPLNDLPEFYPKKISTPSEYDPAPKKYLEHPSTMDDVARFVMEYIISDVLGIIAINWLIIADQSTVGIFDPDCLTLADLHSQAVDYQKSGEPVALSRIPKLKSRVKPDWNAPETINPDVASFYPSKSAIGKLFRAIDLPAQRTINRESRYQRRRAKMDDYELNDLTEALTDLDMDYAAEDPTYVVVRNRVEKYIDTSYSDHEEVNYTAQIFQRFVFELRNICAAHALSPTRAVMLTEEEVIIGTIVAKSSQPRKRKDLISKLREQSDLLVRGIREELGGNDDATYEESLQRAWLAWELSVAQRKSFGAKSFGWVALGVIFESIKEIEDAEKEEWRSRRAR